MSDDDITSCLPSHLPGLPTHILLKCTGLKPPGQLSLVELVSGSGRPLRTVPVPLPSDLGEHGLWSLPEIRTPSQSFFIKVTGKDEEGYRFQRLSSVSYTNIVPGKDNPLPADGSQRVEASRFLCTSLIFRLDLSPAFPPPWCRSPSCEHARGGEGFLHAAHCDWLLGEE